MDNLLLYNGPTRENWTKKTIVTMNQTDSQLRFDIKEPGAADWSFVMQKTAAGSLSVRFGNNAYSQYIDAPFNYIASINAAIMDTSAHSVVEKSVLRFLRQFGKVDPFDVIADPVESTLRAIYPVLGLIPTYTPKTVELFTSRREYKSALQQSTVQGMVMKMFGKKRYRKDLVKALAGANSLELVAFLLSIKREVPVDWFINILRNNPSLKFIPDGFDYDRMKRFYDSMSDKQFRKFCKCLESEDYVPLQSIIDMARQYQECLEQEIEGGDSVRDIKFKSIEDFHYWIGKYHEATAKERERREKMAKYGGPIQNNEWYDKIRQIDFTDAPYEVVVPEDAYELVEWGKQMSNCIAGYASYAKKDNGEVYLALKDKKGVMKANILMHNGVISQFYSKKNGNVDDRIALDFNMRLVLSGFITNTRQLFGRHSDIVLEATGQDDIKKIADQFKALDVSIPRYLTTMVRV